MDFLEKGLLDKLLLGAQVMGCMVMGGLIANYVKFPVVWSLSHRGQNSMCRRSCLMLSCRAFCHLDSRC